MPSDTGKRRRTRTHAPVATACTVNLALTVLLFGLCANLQLCR